MQILREIMAVYDSSLLGDENPTERDAGFKRIADIMVDPAAEMCSAAGEEKQRLRPRWDKMIFMLNCLTYLQVCALRVLSFLLFLYADGTLLQSVLEQFTFTAEKCGELQGIIDERVKALSDEHVSCSPSHLLGLADLALCSIGIF